MFHYENSFFNYFNVHIYKIAVINFELWIISVNFFFFFKCIYFSLNDNLFHRSLVKLLCQTPKYESNIGIHISLSNSSSPPIPPLGGHKAPVWVSEPQTNSVGHSFYIWYKFPCYSFHNFTLLLSPCPSLFIMPIAAPVNKSFSNDSHMHNRYLSPLWLLHSV